MTRYLVVVGAVFPVGLKGKGRGRSHFTFGFQCNEKDKVEGFNTFLKLIILKPDSQLSVIIMSGLDGSAEIKDSMIS